MNQTLLKPKRDTLNYGLRQKSNMVKSTGAATNPISPQNDSITINAGSRQSLIFETYPDEPIAGEVTEPARNRPYNIVANTPEPSSALQRLREHQARNSSTQPIVIPNTPSIPAHGRAQMARKFRRPATIV